MSRQILISVINTLTQVEEDKHLEIDDDTEITPSLVATILAESFDYCDDIVCRTFLTARNNDPIHAFIFEWQPEQFDTYFVYGAVYE